MILPLNDYLCLKLLPQEEKTSSGLLLPTQNKYQTRLAQIKAISLKVQEEHQLNVEDVVILEEQAGINFQYEGEDFLLVKVEHLLARIKA